MRYLVMLMILVWVGVGFMVAEARADWLCTENASFKTGNEIHVCGKGATKTEALKDAQEDFDAICSASADCRGHDVVLTPKRVECNDKGCVRLVIFTIGELTGTSDNVSTFRGYPNWQKALEQKYE